MAIFWIHTTIRNHSDKSLQFAFECDCESIEDLSDDLEAGRIVTGERIDQRRGEDGNFIEIARRQVALSAKAVAMIQEYRS